jgi:predicted transcriptional regulator
MQKDVSTGNTSIRLTDNIDKPLESLANKLDRRKNHLINQSVKDFIARQSLAQSNWSDTLDDLESIKSGKSIAESDVNAWLNSWTTGERIEPPR